MKSLRVHRHARICTTQSFLSRRASTQAKLREQLLSRPPNIIYDYLSPTPSYLLNVSLSNFLPHSCHPPNYDPATGTLPLARHNISHFSDSHILPQGHHLVYFSPPIPGTTLLPDGTDPLHSPGPPFLRRKWAGGSLTFNTLQEYQPELHSTRAACVERITDVTTKGPDGDEKVFVNIERRIGLVESAWDHNEKEIDDQELLDRFMPEVEGVSPEVSLIETRNIVFLRDQPGSSAADAVRPGKVLKPTISPDFQFSLIPTQSLLFRFSALTFNAHAIHLDPGYCRRVEGRRHLLVHGPLTLVLMTSALRSQLGSGEMIERFEYRNLAPLYVDEQLTVCVKKDSERVSKWHIWIEGRTGGYAVKGSAVTGYLST